MNYLLCLMLCLALAMGLASASRDLDTGRQLLQSPNTTDCGRSVSNCVTCRYQFYRGTVTKAICTVCDVGYVVKAGGRACWCAPGYTQDPADVTGNTCIACGENNYCVGAKATKASGAAKVACGANKRTNGDYARSDRECLAQPGYGWALGDAISCEVGFYNPGDNNRKCTRCPGGLTTAGQNTVSTQGCVAPAGYYYLRGRAVACARGTWKSAIGNDDCTLCPEGFTTPLGVVANLAAAGADCTVLMPGYSAGASLTVGTDAATMCLEGSYRVAEQTYSGSAVTCATCPTGMSTQPNVTAATSPDACLVLPGYGWVSGASPGSATPCTAGLYNVGWNRETCSSCGMGTITTDGSLSTSPDDCKIPAGHGTNRSADGLTLMGFVCPMDTYGRPNATYGLVDVECTKCPDHTHTNQTASTGNLDCLTDAGYGWYEGQVLQCEYATYNPGENHNPCTLCKEGYNTSDVGKTVIADCQVAYGWTVDGSGGVKPCLRGYYKEALGTGACDKCPSGTSTTITLAATELSDCDACRPGFGQAVIDYSGSPSCTICGSGYYSPGYVKNGADCTQCSNPTDFGGLMVSRQGVSTPEDCVGEFPTNAVTTPALENKQDWDVIWMNESLTVQAAKTTITACQAGCSATFPNALCQYFEWREWMASGAQCYYKLAAAAIADPGDLSTSDADFILFEVKPGQYAGYLPGTGENVDFVGETLDATITSFTAAVDSCDASAACIGITHKASSGIWRQFKGTKFEGAVGKVKVVGETINPWIAEPTASR